VDPEVKPLPEKTVARLVEPKNDDFKMEQ